MMMDRYVYLYCYLYLLLPLTNFTFADFNLFEEETRLLRTLLNESKYLKKVRPSKEVIVDIRFIFNQIVSMIEKEQIIVTNCFVDQKWKDPRLVWNPMDFGNITWIRMPSTSVWYPDTFLYNTADNAGFLLPQDSQNMIVSYNGTVFWPLPLAQLRTRCRMTIKHFPFDEQTCDMIFGSWSHTSSLIHYQFWENKPEIPQYVPNNEWKLLAVTQSIKTVDYPNWVEPDTFYEVNFTILIVRKPLQAIYNTVVPALMLTILTLVSFFIPFAQEMQIGISIMLAYSVFSLRLSEDVPSQSDSVHLISLYLTVCMFFSLSAMTWFAVANKLREKKRLPYWLRWFALNYISWIVFARNMHRKAVRTVKLEELKTSSIIPSISIANPLPQITTTTTTTVNEMQNSNSCCFERDPLSSGASATDPLLLSKSQPQSSIEKSIHLTTPIQFNTSSSNETGTLATRSPSLVWIRRRLSNIPLTSSSSLKNGPSDKLPNNSPNKSKQSHLTKLLHHSTTKSQESLYAIHVYNRLVFLIFLSFVIIFNIYTWFIYSTTVQTKLLDETSSWHCFDESRLQIVNCSDML
ncbi:unnamed protein product [Rotaria sp. Silwood2]|nr:unnamed protein product [Rotaria sp. Silwood2]CAF2646292.1 unnamed protein product [Rotaria sp. Silwood2]CAF3003681.1 unnamed protein product [Rotaria sp. Silwood2]CAF3867159.1 unnamed protein product [Rotaria sp. Silwood2]CAF4395074.1 unnamed protein product [Rotaria sp. Silwood2]